MKRPPANAVAQKEEEDVSLREDQRLEDAPPSQRHMYSAQTRQVARERPTGTAPTVLTVPQATVARIGRHAEATSKQVRPLPKLQPKLPQRPRLGGNWPKTASVNELTPEEEVMREALRKEAAPIPPLPAHRISHSPQTTSGPSHKSGHERAGQHRSLPHVAELSTSRPSWTQQQSSQSSPSILVADRARVAARLSQLDRHIAETRASQSAQTSAVWNCPDCGSSNPARRNTCRGCESSLSIPPNWVCTSCQYDNFFSNSHCRKCRSPAPNGGWICPSCNYDNFNRNIECKICRSPRQTPERLAEDNVRHWAHLKRTRSETARQRSQVDQPPATRPAEDYEAVARAYAIKQEKLVRLESTKNGEYVALRGEIKDYKPTVGVATDQASRPFLSHDIQRHKDATVVRQPLIREQQVNEGQLNNTRGEGERTPGHMSLLETSPATGQRSMEGFGGVHLSEAEAPFPSSQRTLSRAEISTTKQASAETQLSDRTASHLSRKEKARAAGSEPQRIVRGHERLPTPRRQDPDRVGRNRKIISAYDDMEDHEDDGAAKRMERKEQRKKAKAVHRAAAPPTPIYLPDFISVSNLAAVLNVRLDDFIHKMKMLGFEDTNNDHVFDAETAGLVAAEFNFEPIVERAEERDLLPRHPADDKSILPVRPPVVTIMGHVDHGKTTLLDYLRKSSVAASEHGGITQHIGAFSVPMPGGRLVTFLDTPGHEAFLSMRQRGANVTDIVILVVAADDSVKPQTIEAIKHAQAAKVPLIVAVNKIDKEDSNVDRVKQDLARYGVEIEDYGGETQVICVSGKTGQGMEELEDATVALADILDMRSEVDGQAEGWVLEATTKKAGRVATVLVRRGTLRSGNIIVAGTSWARVRSLRNEAGVMLKSAGPGTPVEIDGWREQPAAGDEVLQAPNEQKAKAVIEYRLEALERSRLAADMAAVNEARRIEQEKREELEKAAALAEANPDDAATAIVSSQAPDAATIGPTFQEVFFVVKADVSGSVEAVTNSVTALGNSEVRPNILRSGVGPVTEFDIEHAAVAKGHIISFNTTVDGNIQRMAEAKEVKILDQSIIYRLIDDVKAKLGEKLPEIMTQRVLGEAEIAQVFEINTKGRSTVPVAGCRVRNGVIQRTGKVRVLRDKEVIYDGMP